VSEPIPSRRVPPVNLFRPVPTSVTGVSPSAHWDDDVTFSVALDRAIPEVLRHWLLTSKPRVQSLDDSFHIRSR
jgi:hypothetical protein